MGSHHYVAAIVASVISLALGASLSWRASNLFFRKVNYFESFEEFSRLSAYFTLGASVACVPTGLLSEMLGRKPAMMLMAIPFAIGWLCLYLADDIMFLLAGRFLTGVSCGAYTVLVPNYVCEISVKRYRGRLCTIPQLMITGGVVMFFSISFCFTVRVADLAACSLCLIYILMLFFIPESPVHLVVKNDMEGARKSLSWLNRTTENYDPTHDIRVIKHSLRHKAGCCSPLWLSFKDKATRKAIMITLGLMVFQQTSGINAVLFYCTSIFEDLSTSFNSREATLAIGVINFVATIVAYNFIDIAGRVLLLYFSASIQILACVGMMIFFSVKSTGPADDVLALGLLSIGSFVFCFASGFGPVPWVIVGEIFSPSYKNYIGTWPTAINWLCAWAVTETFPFLVQIDTEGGAFAIYGLFSAISLIFIIFFVRETKGRTLPQIQDYLTEYN